MKKLITVAVAALALLSLSACGNSSSTSSSSKGSSSVEKASSTKSTDPSKDKWTFKDNVFSAGIETYKFTKSEVRESAQPNKKVLVLYCDITNNSKKEQEPNNIFMVLHAYQKTDTANKMLETGTVKFDDNGNNPIQKFEDGLNDKLLAGKTTQAAIVFTLVNTNNVSVEFQNANGTKIGQKVYQVK